MPRTPIIFTVTTQVFDGVTYAMVRKGDDPYLSPYSGEREISAEYLGEVVAGWRRIGFEPSYIFAPGVPDEWKSAFLGALGKDRKAA